MDKCWFVLKQAYEPPPDDSLRQGTPDGPLCLGHLVRNPKQLDHVVNLVEFVPFERRMMPAKPHTRVNFTWDHASVRDVGLLGKATLPTAAAAGVDVSASIGALFKKRVTNRHEFSRLDQWTMSPSRPYVNQCLNTTEVEDYIKRTKSIDGRWTMYMITGLMIARGGSWSTSTENKGISTTAGVAVQVPVLAEAGPEASFGTQHSSIITTTHASDFIWAVRLAKITKNGLQKDWLIETVVGRTSLFGTRATFSADPVKSTFNPAPVLAAEGLADSVLEITPVDPDTGEYFIAGWDEEEEEEGCN